MALVDIILPYLQKRKTKCNKLKLDVQLLFKKILSSEDNDETAEDFLLMENKIADGNQLLRFFFFFHCR